jgi:hypothetical protein
MLFQRSCGDESDLIQASFFWKTSDFVCFEQNENCLAPRTVAGTVVSTAAQKFKK